jgi:dephospho-CoA kinase
MKQVGLTGNIGSGKTTVCRVFQALGVPVYFADQRAREISDNPQVLQSIRQKFGGEVFDGNNRLMRQKLASVVFNDPEALDTLNAIIHPLVFNDYLQWLEGQKSSYCIQEAAILFETGAYKRFDHTISVVAPEQLRISRTMQRQNISLEDVLRRMKNQLPQQELEQKAEFLIVNDNIQPVIPQVMKLHATFSG